MAVHVVPKKIYAGVFAALVILAVATTAISYLNLGVFNTVIAMTIAVTKAVLVILFFMHVRYSNRLVWVFAGAGFFWLVIMIGLTMSDVLTRRFVSGW